MTVPHHSDDAYFRQSIRELCLGRQSNLLPDVEDGWFVGNRIGHDIITNKYDFRDRNQGHRHRQRPHAMEVVPIPTLFFQLEVCPRNIFFWTIPIFCEGCFAQQWTFERRFCLRFV